MRIKNPSAAKLRVLSLISLVAATFVLSQRTFGQADMVTAGGLVTTTLKTPQGVIQVNLPDEMSGPLSGSIRAFPLGQTTEEKARNLETLNTYAIRMEDRNTPVASGLIQRIIPASQKTVNVIFLDQAGRELGRAAPPVFQPAAPYCLDLTARRIIVPSVAQAGRPLEIRALGLFDGDSTTTTVKLNGQQAPVLAESNRKTVIECPANVAGPAQVEVSKNQSEIHGTVRFLGVSLNAPKLDLRTGEQTTLTTEIRGLKDLQQDVSFRLQNQTPAVVQLAGGDNQNITIRPPEVQGDVYTCTRVVTGKQQGAFNLSATVQDPSPVTIPVVSPDQVLTSGNQPERQVPPPKPGVPEQYFLPAGMVELDRATAQQQSASPNSPARNPCCCCCCCWWGQQQAGGPGPGPGPGGPGPGPGPNPAPGPAPITTNANLGTDKFGPGKSIHVLAVPVTPISPMGYVAEAYVQWNVSGGSGQLTVDVEVQRPGSTRWEKLVTGRGPNDEYLFSTGVAGTYLFRVTGKDAAGNSNFNTLSVTFPCVPGINCH